MNIQKSVGIDVSLFLQKIMALNHESLGFLEYILTNIYNN